MQRRRFECKIKKKLGNGRIFSVKSAVCRRKLCNCLAKRPTGRLNTLAFTLFHRPPSLHKRRRVIMECSTSINNV